MCIHIYNNVHIHVYYKCTCHRYNNNNFGQYTDSIQMIHKGLAHNVNTLCDFLWLHALYHYAHTIEWCQSVHGKFYYGIVS